MEGQMDHMSSRKQKCHSSRPSAVLTYQWIICVKPRACHVTLTDNLPNSGCHGRLDDSSNTNRGHAVFGTWCHARDIMWWEEGRPTCRSDVWNSTWVMQVSVHGVWLLFDHGVIRKEGFPNTSRPSLYESSGPGVCINLMLSQWRSNHPKKQNSWWHRREIWWNIWTDPSKTDVLDQFSGWCNIYSSQGHTCRVRGALTHSSTKGNTLSVINDRREPLPLG